MKKWSSGGRKGSWLPYKRSWKLSNPKWAPTLATVPQNGAFPSVMRCKLFYREAFDIGTTSSGTVLGGKNLYLTNIFDPMSGTGNQSVYLWNAYSTMYQYYHVVGVKYKITGTVFSGTVTAGVGAPTNVVTYGKVFTVPLISSSSGFSNSNDAINWPLTKYRNYATNSGSTQSFKITGYITPQMISGRPYDPSLDNAVMASLVGPAEDFVISLNISQDGAASASNSYMHCTVDCVYYTEFNLRVDTANAPADVPGDS